MFSLFSEYRQFKKLTSKSFDIIFFVENRNYFQYLAHLYDAFAGEERSIAYITSDKNDPILNDHRVSAFYLNVTLAAAFPRLRARVMIMTMPDLNRFIFKRSESVGNYIYVFHALVSTHQQYREGAFDDYDTIFCTGPAQIQEIREREEKLALPAKKLVEYGYPLLDVLEKKASVGFNRQKFLVAPSWYDEGLLNGNIIELLDHLSATGREVWLRPHPEFVKRRSKVWKQITQMCSTAGVKIDASSSVYTHLADAGILITDRSGIAFEYAFSTNRPVLYIDTPLKIQNPASRLVSVEPMENAFRSGTGISVAPGNLNEIAEKIRELEATGELWSAAIATAKSKMVFDKSCHCNGIDHIRSLL